MKTAEVKKRAFPWRGMGWVLTSSSVFVLMVWLMLPYESVELVWSSLRSNQQVWGASVVHLLVLALLSGVIGAGLLSLYETLKRQPKRELRKLSRARRGTVITETLITLPPFFLLCFGLSQQAMNSMAQILANVAVHRAAHSVWVWEPERTESLGRARSEDVAVRGCIAVANVMTPVAPGDYSSIGTSPEPMRQMRAAHTASHIPLGGSLPGAATTLLNAVDSAPTSMLMGSSNSMARALDSTDFVLRTVLKFTAAYRACTVTFANATVSSGQKSVPGYNVSMTYFHFQSMPLVGRFFSGWFTEVPFTGDVVEYGTHLGTAQEVWRKTGRIGHFITINRSLEWPKQVIKPNNRMPNNMGSGSNGSGDDGGGLRGAVSGGSAGGG